MPLLQAGLEYSKFGVEIANVLTTAAMMTDKARNDIVRRHLATDVDWLYFIDDDNVNRAKSLKTLLDHEKELIGGLYFNRESCDPIAYIRNDKGMYTHIQDWTKGDILSADAGGMNGLLVHRCVFEKIDEEYLCFNRRTGGVLAVHQDDIDFSDPPHPKRS